jgi:uncharacterized protein
MQILHKKIGIKMMKLLIFVDSHGNKKIMRRLKSLSKKVDLVICAGDFTVMEKNMNKILKDLNEFYSPVLMVPGNHEDEIELGKLCEKFENIIYIHKGAHHFEDYVFLGYGGGGFSEADPDFKRISENFFKNEIKGKKRSILVLHGPPHGTKVDMINNGYAGDKNFRKFIDESQPHLVVCGHLHENVGKKDKIGRTLIINPGPKGVIVEI